MGSPRLPRVHLLTQSQLGQDSFQSLLISLLRGLAAIQVAAAHLRAEVFPGLTQIAHPAVWYEGLGFITGFAHQAVLVFFLISGWLVGGSLLNKIGQSQAIRGYAIDRITRLWTVLIPTFVLMILVAMVANVDTSTSNDLSVLSFVGNLAGLQTISVPNFGGDYSLWSLANETWYYVLFPLAVLLFVSRRRAVRAACGVVIVLIAVLVPFDIFVFFSIWLLGVAFSRIRIECGPLFRIAWLSLVVAVAVYYRLRGATDDLNAASFGQDLICSLVFGVLLSGSPIKTDLTSRPMKLLAKTSVFFAGFSFTLYVVHVPLIQGLRYAGQTWFGRTQLSPDAWSGLAIYLVMLSITLAGAYLSYLLFESHTYRVRRLARDIFLKKRDDAVPRVAVIADHLGSGRPERWAVAPARTKDE